jgi:hypothetical protein
MTAEILAPLRAEPQEPRNIVTFDLESKKPHSQLAGFERPFMVGMYDTRSKQYLSFFDDESLDKKDAERAFKPGGCINKFFRWLTESKAGKALQSRSVDGRVGSILYAHNGGAFDTLHLLRWLRLPENAKRFRVRMVASGSQLLELRVTPTAGVRKHKGRRGKKKKVYATGWTIRDSVRLAPGSLDEVSRKLKLGIEKTRMPKELGGLDAHEKHQDAWRAYNRPDCEVAARLVETLQRILHDLGGQLGMTLPASAMDLFRRRFLREFLENAHLAGCPGDRECPDYLFGGCNFLRGRSGLPRERHWPGCPSICPECRHPEHCSKQCSRRNRRRKKCPAEPYGCLHAWLTLAPTGARHGGRTEVFFHKETEGKLRYYDRNSSYAAAMLEPMPLRLFSTSYHVDGDPYEFCEKQAAKELVGFIECTVYVPESCNIPPLPIVFKDRLVFPTGYFHGRWDWTELRHLKEVGGKILYIDRSAWYRAAPVIAPMMRTLYGMRLRARRRGNSALDEVCKDIMNALYGKFIMSPERHEITSAPEDDAPEYAEPMVAEVALHAPLGTPQLYKVPLHIEAAYFLPHIGAHITALGRESLWLFMRQIEKAGGHVVYCDTDAAIYHGGPEMPSSDVIGRWKRVHGRVKKLAGVFDSPKSYALTSLSGEPLDKVHTESCKAARRDGDPKAFACDGCATTAVHIKGLHRGHHTMENFDALLRGETIQVENQTPKLGELMACDFSEYETRVRKISSRAKRPLHDQDFSLLIGKRVRVGDASRPLVMSGGAQWIYVDDGQRRLSTLKEHFEWLAKRRRKREAQLMKRPYRSPKPDRAA